MDSLTEHVLTDCLHIERVLLDVIGMYKLDDLLPGRRLGSRWIDRGTGDEYVRHDDYGRAFEWALWKSALW
jgi:hypothetical protein